jgi:hypothetical protein
MNSASELSAADIQLELERIFGKEHRANLAALYGKGEAGTLSARGREWTVVPTNCEMELRACMPEHGNLPAGQGLVFLLDWTERPLPLDLSSRLAGQRVFRISRGTRLAVLLGARQTEPGLMETGLAAVLLSGEVSRIRKVTSPVLTRKDAYRRFLDAWLGVPVTDELTPARVLSWCMASSAGPALGQKAGASEPWSKLRDELRAFVGKEADELAALGWIAWEQGLTERFVQLAVLVDAHRRAGDPVAEGILQGQLGQLGPGFGPQLMALAGALNETRLLDAVLDEIPTERRRALVDEAEALIPLAGFDATRRASPWLRAGHAAREADLAAAVQALVADPSVQTHAGLLSAAKSVNEHRLDGLIRSTSQRESRHMALRLASYLVHRGTRPGPATTGAAYQAAIDLARQYAAEGGFVDWCRQRLRGTLAFGEPLDGAIRALVESADACRRDDDRQFAQGLLHWNSAGRPSTQVLSIDAVIGQLVEPLLGGHPNRKILVVVMDGMSWASAVQLLTRLEQETWAPIVWRPKGHEAQLHGPPVLADLPTSTEVSRATLLAGKRDKRSPERGTGDDGKRWAANKAALKIVDGEVLPPLVMRSNLMSGDSLHGEVRKAVKSEARVLAVIVNAIDENLKGSDQTLIDYSQTTIKPLTGLLTEAAGAERIVLLVGDHGHVPGDGLSTHGIPDPAHASRPRGRRWRALDRDEQPREFEIRLPASCWCPRGWDSVAAIWDEHVSNLHPRFGEHGGVSMPEVVTPALLVAPEWLSRALGDETTELETRPFPAPDWWHLEVVPLPERIAREPVPPQPAVQQMSFPGCPTVEPATPVAPVAPVAPSMPDLVQALKASKVFHNHSRDRKPTEVEQVLGWLAVLVEAGDSAAAGEFARKCHERPHRVNGLVARMGLILNIDGYDVVKHDVAAKQVVLNRGRLVQQYGLST